MQTLQRNQFNRLGNAGHSATGSSVSCDLQGPDFTLLTPERLWYRNNRLFCRSLGGVPSSLWGRDLWERTGHSFDSSVPGFTVTNFTDMKDRTTLPASFLVSSWPGYVHVERIGQVTGNDFEVKTQTLKSLLHCRSRSNH